MRKIYLISALEKNVIIDPENIVYKIGITLQKKDKRLKQLQTGTDKKLEIVKEFESKYPFKVESYLHKYFKEKRISREWFKLNENDVSGFIELCKSIEKNFSVLENLKNPFI